jgi:4-hydroxybenzoate polyprenyltransferase
MAVDHLAGSLSGAAFTSGLALAFQMPPMAIVLGVPTILVVSSWPKLMRWRRPNWSDLPGSEKLDRC